MTFLYRLYESSGFRIEHLSPQSYHDLPLTLSKGKVQSITTAVGESAVFPDRQKQTKKNKQKNMTALLVLCCSDNAHMRRLKSPCGENQAFNTVYLIMW